MGVNGGRELAGPTGLPPVWESKGWLSQHFLGHTEYVLSCEFGDQVPHTGDSKSPSLYRLQGKAEYLSSIKWETEPREGGACLTTQYPEQCGSQPGA